MADTEVEVAKPATPTAGSPGNRLSKPTRIIAYALGFASLGAGGVAVFITHVEAGPVALLAVGLIFMIVALSGRLPTRLRVGDNEAEWQEFAGNVIETAVDASPPSVKAELATQLSELAEVAPRAAAPALSGLAYESHMAATIAHVAALNPNVRQVETWAKVEGAGEFDFVLKADGNRFILVELKSALNLSVSAVAAIVAKAQFYREAYPDRKTGLLLVSRYRLSASVQAIFMQSHDAACIVFRGSEDEPALTGAINGLLSSLGS